MTLLGDLVVKTLISYKPLLRVTSRQPTVFNRIF